MLGRSNPVEWKMNATMSGSMAGINTTVGLVVLLATQPALAGEHLPNVVIILEEN
jgi:hypothetical protein